MLTSDAAARPRKRSTGKRRPSTSSSAPSACGDAARHRLDPPGRGGSPWVPGITSTVAWWRGIVEPEELDGCRRWSSRASANWVDRLAAEAQGVRPGRGDRRQRLAQAVLRRQERERDVGRHARPPRQAAISSSGGQAPPGRWTVRLRMGALKGNPSLDPPDGRSLFSLFRLYASWILRPEQEWGNGRNPRRSAGRF